MDGDRNRIDDVIDADAKVIAADLLSADPARQALGASRADEEIAVEAVFSRPMPAAATTTFTQAGGIVRHVFHSIGYGFTGRIARSAIDRVTPLLGADLLLIKAEQIVVPHLDESTKTSRVRPVWAPGFAGNAAGLRGSPNVNIAIVDGGVDPTHPDLAGRMIGWKDYTSEATATAEDVLGHGTHVAGIALGSGAAFGVGPGTLSWTESGDDSNLTASDWIGAATHLPASFMLTSTATFEGGGSTMLSLLKADDGSTLYTSIKSSPLSASPFTLTFDGTAAPGTHHTLGLRQNAARDVAHFAVANKITNYPAAGDGFPAFRGVAAGSGWYAAKIFPAVGNGTTADISEALDDILALRESLKIKVVNCSFGITSGGTDTVQRAKVNTLVENGIVVVASSGNNGGTGQTADPGRAASAITVGAANDVNQVTSYSSGVVGNSADSDDKPDLVAPGGSSYRSKILSADTNTSEAGIPGFADVQANDYTSNMGTSMAAPVVSGSAALLIQALEAKGFVWDYQSNKSAYLVKMLLLASATETNDTRETNSVNPVLGRAGSPRDNVEGFGIVNPDAAIEAATLPWDFKTVVSGATNGGRGDRRAWGRKVTVPAGHTLKLNLAVPATGDFDVYVYESTPSSKGTPVLQAWSDFAGSGVNEQTTWTFVDKTDLYVVVKRIAGSGTFTLSGTTFTCGNGKLEPGEQCDDNNTSNGDCCNSACQFESGACAADAGATIEGTDGGVPDAATDAATDADADAGPVDEPDSAAPPFTEVPPPATAAPTNPTPPGAAPQATEPPSAPERFEVGGGGCSASPRSFAPLSFAATFGIMLGLLAMRRRRRAVMLLALCAACSGDDDDNKATTPTGGTSSGGTSSSGGSPDAGTGTSSSGGTTTPPGTVEAGPMAGNPDGKAVIPAEAAAESVATPTTVIGKGAPDGCTGDAFVDAVAKGGVITFNCGPDPITITLTKTAKIFNDKGPKIVIDGGGKVTLSGGGKVRILYQSSCDKRQVLRPGDCNKATEPQLTVQNLTFIDGSAKGLQEGGAPGDDKSGGGAIYAQGGLLKVVNSRFFNNVCDDADSDIGGGAIRKLDYLADGVGDPSRKVWIANSTFGGDGALGNTCANGGAISSIGISWTILNSLFMGNKAIGHGANGPGPTHKGGNGGAIYNDGRLMKLDVEGTIIKNNSANEGGSAIFFVSNDSTGSLTIKDSTLTGNPRIGFDNPDYPGTFLQLKGKPEVVNSTLSH